MLELELLGLHSDGNYLVLTAEDGSRYTLLINDALRAAVRKDRPHLEAIHAANSSLSVKDIQVLIRAGASVEEIAMTYDISIDRLRKYERPIIAERTWAAERALSCRVNGDPDSPLLGDIVIDRLAARGVDPNFMEWTAIKKNDEPWEIVLTFVQGTTERQAHWSMSETGNGIYAIDEEAHWLTETAMPPTIPDIVVPITKAEDLQEPQQVENIDELLDQLSAVRGTRQNADIYGDDNSVSLPQSVTSDVDNVIAISSITGNTDKVDSTLFGDFSAVTNQESTSSVSDDELEETQLSLPVIQEEEAPIQTPKPVAKKTNKRQSVPTWDEIVFGGKIK